MALKCGLAWGVDKYGIFLSQQVFALCILWKTQIVNFQLLRGQKRALKNLGVTLIFIWYEKQKNLQVFWTVTEQQPIQVHTHTADLDLVGQLGHGLGSACLSSYSHIPWKQAGLCDPPSITVAAAFHRLSFDLTTSLTPPPNSTHCGPLSGSGLFQLPPRWWLQIHRLKFPRETSIGLND